MKELICVGNEKITIAVLRQLKQLRVVAFGSYDTIDTCDKCYSHCECSDKNKIKDVVINFLEKRGVFVC
jgi:hypothetical protein